jgi:cytochrome bd-type quinol oxidase subunit 2
MKNSFQNIPEIIAAASTSPLAIFSLILLLTALLSYLFFYKTRKNSIKMAAFSLTMASFFLIAYLAWSPPEIEQQSIEENQVSQPQSKQETHGNQSPIVSEMKGGAINYYGAQKNSPAGGKNK